MNYSCVVLCGFDAVCQVKYMTLKWNNIKYDDVFYTAWDFNPKKNKTLSWLFCVYRHYMYHYKSISSLTSTVHTLANG